MITKIILPIIVLSFYSQLVIAEENNNIDNKPPIKKKTLKSQKIQTLTQSDLFDLSDFSRKEVEKKELPINHSVKSPKKNTKDIAADHLTHRDITSANTRPNVSNNPLPHTSDPYGGAMDRQRMINSARGPNSMHQNLRQRETSRFHRSAGKK